MRANGWWRRNSLSDRWEKLGLSEGMPVLSYVHSALGACGELQLFEYCATFFTSTSGFDMYRSNIVTF